MTILVTGATGNVGRRLVRQLAADGRPVRALTRNPTTADVPAGVEAAAGDLLDPASLTSALSGVTALHLLAATNDGGGALATAPELLELAGKAGVRRVTVLGDGTIGPVQEAVRASGLEWTFLHPMEFMSNSQHWAESVRIEGVVREPFPDAGNAVVDVADVAAVAAVALTEDGHAGQTYRLTGPQVLTVPQRVEILAKAIGRDVRYVELSRDQARERMRGMVDSEELIEYVLGWQADPPAEARTVSPAVEQVTGRPARDFAQWAAEHAEVFRA